MDYFAALRHPQEMGTQVNRPTRFLRNAHGFSLPATLLVIAGIGISMYTIVDLRSTTQRLNAAQNSIVGAEIARSKILGAIMNSQSWLQTRTRNSSYSHSTPGGGNLGGPSYPGPTESSIAESERAITFYNADGSVFYNPGGSSGIEQGPVHAFGADGEMFQLYPRSESQGPLPPVYFRVVVNILERDPNPTCTNCADQVAGYIEVIQPDRKNPTPVLPIYTGSLGFGFTRTHADRSQEQTCMLVGGSYDQNTGCSYRLGFQGSCREGKLILGYNGQTHLCGNATSLADSACPKGQYARGMRNGRFICGELPNAHGPPEPILTCPKCAS